MSRSVQSQTPLSPPITPITAITPTDSLRSLPPNLIDMVKNTPAQQNINEYDAVHVWWWIVYEDLLADMKQQGENSGWREMDKAVHW